MLRMMKILAHFTLGLALAGLLFCYVTWGDFSWLTLLGPLTLEPSFKHADGPQYVASPAFQAIITRVLFLVTCLFFCMIPNLVRGIWQNIRYIVGSIAMAYVLFSYLLGSWTFFALHAPEASTLRLLSVMAFFVLLVCGYNAHEARFSVPALWQKRGLRLPLLGFFAVIFMGLTLFFQGMGWLYTADIGFVLLRLCALLTALTAALAVHAKRCGL